MVLRAVGKAGWCCCVSPCEFVLCASTFNNNWSDIDTLGTDLDGWRELPPDVGNQNDYVIDGRIWRQQSILFDRVVFRPAPFRIRTETKQVVTWTAHVSATTQDPLLFGIFGHKVSSNIMGQIEYGTSDQLENGTITGGPGYRYFLSSVPQINFSNVPTTLTFESTLEVGPVIRLGTFEPSGECFEVRSVNYILKIDGQVEYDLNIEGEFFQHTYDLFCSNNIVVQQSSFFSGSPYPDPYHISAVSVVTT